MPNTVKKYINIDPRHSGLMEQRLQERENTVTPLENPDLESIPIQSHYQVNPSYWGNTTVNGEPVDITGYRDSNTGIARYQDGEYGYVNLPDNYGEWMMDGVTIYPERPRLKGVVHNYFDDAQQSKILGQPNVIAPIGVGDSEIQPIQFPTKAPEKYHGQDLDRFFANLLTFGTAGTEEYASQLFKEGDYLKGSIYAGLPLLVKGGPSGNLLRAGFWGYNLYNDANDAIKMIQDRNGWGYGKDTAKIILDTGALLYDGTKGLLDAQPYLQDIARQRNNMGYWARTASDIAHHPLDTYRTVRKGTYVHDSPSLRRAITESKQAVREGADYTRNYYQDALKVDMPEANITAKTNIPGAWGEQIPGTNNFYYTFYRSPLSNLSRNTRDFKRVGGHEYTHLAEDYLNNRYFFPSLNVPAKPYYLPNVNHPIMSTATVDDFIEGNIHGRSPEETWANYMGYNAGGGDPVMSFTDYNIKKEGIPPPRGFISDYENYLKSLSSKALQREGEIQLFNRRYGQKALGGTITNNSDSIILADNNNYIQDFKGRQYGLPTVRYADGGHLFGDGGTTAGPEVIITPDEKYNRFLNTLPDNQRLTPNEDYDTYLYWKLNGKPKNFKEALDKGMYAWDDSDNSYHGNSIAWGDDGTGYFIKPKHHDTLKYELDWFNKNIVTEPGGHQRFETAEERAESDRFRENYVLADDPDRPDFYIYKPKDQVKGLNIYKRQNDLSIKEKDLGGHLSFFR